MNDNGVFLCGECHAALDGPAGDNPFDMLACPECGQSDLRQTVAAEAAAYLAAQAGDDRKNAARDEARKRAVLHFAEATVPRRSYRYIWEHRR